MIFSTSTFARGQILKTKDRAGRVVVSGRADEGSSPPRKDWQRTVGMFRNDPIMEEIIEAGRRIREEDRQQAAES